MGREVGGSVDHEGSRDWGEVHSKECPPTKGKSKVFRTSDRPTDKERGVFCKGYKKGRWVGVK